jgi:hypothetical protein
MIHGISHRPADEYVVFTDPQGESSGQTKGELVTVAVV